MANLPETPDYPAGVYQLETSDPVLGGPGGISNRQAEQLGNRTAWLKAKIDAFLDGTVAVLKATKLATARTLSFSGAASGSAPFDGSADANIVLTLADSGAVAGTYPKVTINAKGLVTAGAPLTSADIPADLALAGAPTAPTAAAVSNNTQLANTAFVKAAISALVASSPAALDTLNELAAALGNDPNFATTITNALAGKAPLASPALTGNPSAPTPAQFDNDGSLATTEFVQRALGNHKTVLGINAATTLTAAAAGSFVSLFGAGAFSVTLPLGAAVPVGAKFSFLCIATPGQVFVQPQGTDQITLSGSSVVTGFDLYSGDTLEVVWTGTSWAAAGSIQAKYQPGFGSSLNASGYKKIPDASSPTGFIIEQWGSWTPHATPGNSVAVTFPIAFPNALRSLVVSSNANTTVSASSAWTSDSSNVAFNGRTTASPATFCSYRAIGY
ncbi:gp53-like domain-containing protein [Ectopseudomonas oleovorans]|uniref:gp53-like domain-containing protein n=1 Tax=Ectopseudomonas oleovorans TaxID=301 RepID=UPI001C8B8D90|nr:hypothetical protein [Pseudomonas oleovorans]